MGQSRRLTIVLVLNLVLVVALAVAGVAFGSVSLLAAAGDSVADGLALGLGLVAVHLRDRHGSANATNLVALLNVLLLLAVTGSVWIEAAHRLAEGSPAVAGLPVLLAAVATMIVLGAGVLVLGRGAGKEDLHMRSVLLDTAADGLAAAAVAATGAVMALAHGLYWLDPVVAAGIGLIVAAGGIRLLLDVVRALRAGTTVEVDPD